MPIEKMGLNISLRVTWAFYDLDILCRSPVFPLQVWSFFTQTARIHPKGSVTKAYAAFFF